VILHRWTFLSWALVNKHKPRTIEKLWEEIIRLVNSELDPEMCQRVIVNFVTIIKAFVSVAEVDTCLILK